MDAAASPSWEEVLASFEASATYAESVLVGETPAPVAVAYDVWQLSLPPMPDELRPRAEEVQRRQLRLAEHLRGSMKALRQQQLLTEPQHEPRRALFVDHLV